MSSTNKTANYELSQFVGTDIPSILNDYNGDMRKIDTAIKEVATSEGSISSDMAELQVSVRQHTTEINGLSATVNSLSGRVVGIENKIPANASEENKLVTVEDISDIGVITEMQEQLDLISGDVKGVKLCIPEEASKDNKVALASDVENVSTRLSNFRDTYNNVFRNYQLVLVDTTRINSFNAFSAFISEVLSNITYLYPDLETSKFIDVLKSVNFEISTNNGDSDTVVKLIPTNSIYWNEDNDIIINYDCVMCRDTFIFTDTLHLEFNISNLTGDACTLSHTNYTIANGNIGNTTTILNSQSSSYDTSNLYLKATCMYINKR